MSPFDVLLGVPVDSSGAFVGCQRMPAALRAAGIVERLGIEDLGNLQVTIADPVRDPGSGVIGLRDVVAATAVVHAAVAGALSARRRPLLIGGDCTLLLGVAAALQDADAGLLFVDGHLDCYDGKSSLTGECADLELAAVLGVGAPELTGPQPLLAADRVVVLGPSDEAEAAADGAPDPRVFAPEMRIVAEAELHADPAGHARAAIEQLGSFWLHLDLDVLSSAELPAVDYPAPEGLTWDELGALLEPVLAAPGLIGADVTILNPTLDERGRGALKTVELLAQT